MDERLTDRQRKFIQAVASGLSAPEAARQAGFSASYAKKASRLLRCPVVAMAIEAIHSEARREAVYGIQEHVKELDQAILAAYAHKAMMAVSRLLRDKGEAYGLYVQRVSLVPDIQLRDALVEARNRVFGLLDITPKPSEVLTDARRAGPEPAKVTADGSPTWKPLMD